MKMPKPQEARPFETAVLGLGLYRIMEMPDGGPATLTLFRTSDETLAVCLLFTNEESIRAIEDHLREIRRKCFSVGKALATQP
jgi:hypothetical protein